MEQQEKLLSRLKSNLPKNLLLIGPKYSGKKTLINEIIDMSYIWVDNNVETIRSLSKSTNYIFADIDDWAPVCFSAMLKLLEENSEYHYILTCKNIMNIPESIQSRCVIEYMEPYKNIGYYCDNIGQVALVTLELIENALKLNYKDEFDFDVFFTVVCNQLLEKLINGEDVSEQYLITSIYNSNKTIKSLNKKQFVNNWKLDLQGITSSYKNFSKWR